MTLLLNEIPSNFLRHWIGEILLEEFPFWEGASVTSIKKIIATTKSIFSIFMIRSSLFYFSIPGDAFYIVK